MQAGATPQSLVDSISETGGSVLLPDGRVFVIGATGYTALYTVPPIANQPGSWVAGPTIPKVNGVSTGTVDAPAALLPNGRVLFAAGPITVPATFKPPTYFFEYDPATNAISQVSEPPNSTKKAYWDACSCSPRERCCSPTARRRSASTPRTARTIRCGARKERDHRSEQENSGHVERLSSEIDDQKLIREELDLFGRQQEEWLENVRTVAVQLDDMQQLSRSFISPEERPPLGIPEPDIETPEPERISEEARSSRTTGAVSISSRSSTSRKSTPFARPHDTDVAGRGGEEETEECEIVRVVCATSPAPSCAA